MDAIKPTDSIEELERMKYVHLGPDERQDEYLAIDIEGLALERSGILWVWAYRPRPIGGEARGYEYPSFGLAYDCTSDNSLRVELAGKLANRQGDRQDMERVWIPIQVPDASLDGIQYLLLPTSVVRVPGWGL
jgi:hypothetical protein